MYRKPHLVACIVLSLFFVSRANAADYSIDPISAETVTNAWAPGDIIFAPGFPVLRIACRADLGLPAAANVDGFSYGIDPPLALGPDAISIITYSVTRADVGIAGLVVNTQVTGNGAAGDKYRLRINNAGVVLGRGLRSDAPTHGLTTLPNESELDGLSNIMVMPIPSVTGAAGIAFTVDRPTATAIGVSPADILYRAPVIIAPPPPPGCIISAASTYAIYATQTALGLAPNDNIDALAMWDTITPGTLNSGDFIYVSLDPASPTLAAIGASPASMIQVYPGPPTEVVTPDKFALLPTDDIDALTLGDPEVCYGDIDRDRDVDIDDVGPFVSILLDQLAHITANPTHAIQAADMNGDWRIDGHDIHLFTQAVLQGDACD